MSHNLDEPAKRIHIYMYERDLERIDAYLGSRLTRSEKIRRLCHAMLDSIQSKVNLKAKPIELGDSIDLELDL